MLDDHYTIKLDGGKYTVINHRNRLEFLRHDEPWPAGQQLSGAKVVHAMLDRIEELEMAIGQVLRGSIIAGPRVRADDGMNNFDKDRVSSLELVEGWETRLRNVLEQKP